MSQPASTGAPGATGIVAVIGGVEVRTRLVRVRVRVRVRA